MSILLTEENELGPFGPACSVLRLGFELAAYSPAHRRYADEVPEGESIVWSSTPEQAESVIGELAELLIDAVDSGASIGFMPPLLEREAIDYWRSVIAAVREGSRVLLVARENGRIEGSVQLALELRANGNHRAEAMKLFVNRRSRRRGLAKKLMLEAETVARSLGRRLLVMDTRKGGEAEKLCEGLGYVCFGEVPNYARSGDGALHTTVFFYRQL